jgi:hypothetical protein
MPRPVSLLLHVVPQILGVGKGFSFWAEELGALAAAAEEAEDEEADEDGEGRIALALDAAASTFLVALPGTQRWGG